MLARVDFLQSQLFAGFTVLQVGGAIVAVFVLLRALDWFRSRRKVDDANNFDGRCGCGWKGKVSKFARKCPMCNDEIIRS